MIQIVNCLNGILAVLEEIAELLTPAESNSEAKAEQREEKPAEEPVTEEPVTEEPVTRAKVTRTKKEVM